MNNINDDELCFVVKHYKPKIAVAASIILAVGIAVAAGIIGYHNYMLPQKPILKPIPVDTAYVIEDYEESDTTDVFRFDHTPINKVLGELSRYYNTNLYASDTTKSVTGEIEASKVEDAIDVLETTLGIKIERR